MRPNVMQRTATALRRRSEEKIEDVISKNRRVFYITSVAVDRPASRDEFVQR
jgi:hypothetical protein